MYRIILNYIYCLVRKSCVKFIKDTYFINKCMCMIMTNYDNYVTKKMFIYKETLIM